MKGWNYRARVSFMQEKVMCPINLKIVAHKMLNNFVWPVTVAKKCPAEMAARVVNPAIAELINYLAIGTNGGHILFYNVQTGSICKEFYVHNNPVRWVDILSRQRARQTNEKWISAFSRGIEWFGVSYIMSWAYGEATNGKVKNEIIATSVTSGQFRQIRSTANAESPIELIRVSPLRWGTK